MFKNYFRTARRNFIKNRLLSVIKIAGLAMEIGCCLVMLVFIAWNRSQDGFQKIRNKRYVVERIESKEGAKQLWGNSTAPISPMLKSDNPQTENYARLDVMNAVRNQGDHVFGEQLSFKGRKEEL